MRQGPRPIISGLFTAPYAGSPMEQRRQVEVVPGVGIIGDRYAAHLGHWSDPKWPDQELTLVEGEVADALEIDAGQLRRNIVTRGIRLDDLLGCTVHIGDAVIIGIRRCDPCRYLDGLTRPGLARVLAGRGGVRAHILQGGQIHVADQILL